MRSKAHVRFGEEKQGNSSTTPCFLLYSGPKKVGYIWPWYWICIQEGGRLEHEFPHEGGTGVRCLDDGDLATPS